MEHLDCPEACGRHFERTLGKGRVGKQSRLRRQRIYPHVKICKPPPTEHKISSTLQYFPLLYARSNAVTVSSEAVTVVAFTSIVGQLHNALSTS